MSWQCPICETVNQDVTPVCTVCDNLAPVIDSYLSLAAIDRLREYNEKLDTIHVLESEGRYEEMLEESIAAIALYQENGLALEKARHALTHIQQNKLTKQLRSYLDEAVDKREYGIASDIIKIADHLRLIDDGINAYRSKVKLKISNIKEVDDYLDSSFKALMDLDTNLALQVVEEGMLEHTHSKRLKQRREDVKRFITNLNGVKKTEISRGRKLPTTSTRRNDSASSENISKSNDSHSGKTKRKYPTVKR